MSSAASPDNARLDHSHAESGPAAGYFTEVLVYAGILHAAAELLELLHDFVSDADPVVRVHLGRFLIAYRVEEGTGDPGLEAAILITELNEAADLLHALGGDTGEETMASEAGHTRRSGGRIGQAFLSHDRPLDVGHPATLDRRPI